MLFIAVNVMRRVSFHDAVRNGIIEYLCLGALILPIILVMPVYVGSVGDNDTSLGKETSDAYCYRRVRNGWRRSRTAIA